MITRTSIQRYFLFLLAILLVACQPMGAQDVTLGTSTFTAEAVTLNPPAVSPSPDYGATATHILSIPTNATPFRLPTLEINHPSPDSPTYVAETLTAMPTVSPTITSTPDPHACAFPLAQTTIKESTPQEYTFSEPQVVLTDDYPDIADWLPDNQNVIIMSLKTHQFDGIDGHSQTIELFNPETKETHVYATRRYFGDEPLAWNSALNALIYPAPNVLGLDKTTYRLTVTRQLRSSDGNPDTTQLLLDNLRNYYPMTFKPDGSQTVYWGNNGKQNYKLYRHRVSHEPLVPEQLIPFDPTLFGNDGYSIPYEMSWRPNASQLFLYSGGSPTSQTLLVDANTGRSCILNFDGWVYHARWSPNGRYLAVITQKGPMLSLWSDLDLRVLDTVTGKIYEIDSSKIVPPNRRHTVSDLAWAPDNHHLAIIGSANTVGTSPPPTISRLYLVDFLSGEVDNLFPTYQFDIGWWGRGLAWSPDGSKIMAKCPTETEGRLCLIPVLAGGK